MNNIRDEPTTKRTNAEAGPVLYEYDKAPVGRAGGPQVKTEVTKLMHYTKICEREHAWAGVTLTPLSNDTQLTGVCWGPRRTSGHLIILNDPTTFHVQVYGNGSVTVSQHRDTSKFRDNKTEIGVKMEQMLVKMRTTYHLSLYRTIETADLQSLLRVIEMA